MFQQLNNIRYPIQPAEEVTYLLNSIKTVNENMNTGNIIIKTDRIGMAVEFEYAVVH